MMNHLLLCSRQPDVGSAFTLSERQELVVIIDGGEQGWSSCRKTCP